MKHMTLNRALLFGQLMLATFELHYWIFLLLENESVIAKSVTTRFETVF